MNTVPVPDRIARLPVDKRGYPVPWFVAWVDGVPDFRVVGEGKIVEAFRFKRCWICGDTLGRNYTFVIGPMCAVNRTSSEPPSHRECAIYAARACPFLTRPKMKRNESDLPEHVEAAGCSIKRNPGVALVWTTRTFRPFTPPGGGVLFQIGDPAETLWFAEGREATRSEVQASFDSGLPLLRDMCDTEETPARCEEARRQLAWMTARALAYLPQDATAAP